MGRRRFAGQEESRAGGAAIVALRGHAQQILNSEIRRVRIRHDRKATAEEVEFARRHMLRQLLCTYPRSGLQPSEGGGSEDSKTFLAK